MTLAARPPKRRAAARHQHLVQLEVRADNLPAGVCGRVQGIALVYGVVDAYGTRFAKGCLDRTKREKVAAGKVQLYADHEYGVRTHIGVVRTLETVGDAEVMTADLFDTEDGRRSKEYLGAVMAAQARTGLSIGFYAREVDPVSEGDRTVWEYREVELEEISSTPRPAVPGADVTGVRADPTLFATALRGIRAALGAETFATLVAELDATPPADSSESASARHTDEPPDSRDAPPGDSSDAAAAETPAPASMEERIDALRATYRS